MRRALIELASRVAWIAFWLVYWVWVVPLVLDAVTQAVRALERYRRPRPGSSGEISLVYPAAHRAGADELTVAMHLVADHALTGAQSGLPSVVHSALHGSRVN